jgi:hypothetical protein
MRSFVASVVLAALGVVIASCSSSGGGVGGSGGTGGTGGTGGSEGAGGTSGSGPMDAGGPFDQFRIRNLDDVNHYRATLGIAPVKLDPTLCTFAQAGTVEESMNHIPHAQFNMAIMAGTIWSDGFKMAAGENQGDPNGWLQISPDPTTNELDQIDAIQKAMFDEGPGDGEAHGHYENIMNPAYDRLGVGLLEIGGKLYLTNDFSAL